MKWFAYLLGLANLALWVWSSSLPSVQEWAPQGRPLPRVARLQLANEQATAEHAAGNAHDATPSAPDQEQMAPEQVQDRPPVSPAPSSGAWQCMRIGGLLNRGQAESVIADLPPVKTQIRPYERVLPPLHWVVTPVYPTRAAATGTLRRLQRAGIDSYLVTEGEQRNAISLGLFHGLSAAQDLAEALRHNQGLRIRILSWERRQTEYAVLLRFEKKGIDIAGLSRNVPENADLQIIPCESVASPSKTP